tara:strand:- start:5 stop:184 length:180 start_codon:yes stop_codon:yes gene_type:complete
MPKKKKAKVVEEVEYVSKVYPKGCFDPDSPRFKVTFNGGSWNSTPLKGAEADTKGKFRE